MNPYLLLWRSIEKVLLEAESLSNQAKHDESLKHVKVKLQEASFWSRYATEKYEQFVQNKQVEESTDNET